MLVTTYNICKSSQEKDFFLLFLIKPFENMNLFKDLVYYYFVNLFPEIHFSLSQFY